MRAGSIIPILPQNSNKPAGCINTINKIWHLHHKYRIFDLEYDEKHNETLQRMGK
jgi:hypothetical protein